MCKYTRTKKWFVTACGEAFDNMLLKLAMAFRPSAFEALSGAGKSPVARAPAATAVVVTVGGALPTSEEALEVLANLI